MASEKRPLVVAESMLDLIGQTPLMRLPPPAQSRGASAAVWGKLEHLNPGGSLKDRVCLAMIEDAERTGRLQKGGVVIEPTSGNTGIGLALVCAVKGYACILTMPESMSLERRQLLEMYGATIVLTPAEDQMEGAIREARAIAERTAGGFLPDQFGNAANPKVHARTTAREILHAMRGLSLDAFVAGVGTGGTISGVGEALREELGPVSRGGPRIVAVEPDACATISRGERGPTKIQGLAAGFVPVNYHPDAVDEVRTVTDADAWKAKVHLARRGGLLVGISAGAAACAAHRVAAELGPGKNVVTVMCDTGERYFSLGEFFPEEEAAP